MTTIAAQAKEYGFRQDAEAQGHTRLVLVDDNPIILGTIIQMLRSSYVIAGIFLDGESFLQECTKRRADVLVLDISMHGVSGLEVAESLQAGSSEVKVVFLTVYEDSEFVSSAFSAGASAYVFKSRMATDLILAIDQVHRGGLFVSSEHIG
jgi:two-component system, NarL family, response regulator DesR